MARLRVTAGKRRYAVWLAGMFISACTGVGLETPSAGTRADREQPEDEQVAPPAPSSEETDDDESAAQHPPSDPGPRVEPAPRIDDDDDDEPVDACRAIVRRSDEVVLAFANGEERVLDRNAMWLRTFGQVWAIGEHAIVGVPETEEYVHPAVAALALVHATDGVLWRGTAPTSDYIRATGFRALTREGYVVLNDSRIVDPTGGEHSPLEGFLPVGDSIDEEGFILASRAGELAHWNVRADALDTSVTAALGIAVIEPTQLGGLEAHDAAFVEETATGGLSFTRVSRSEAERATLTPELADRLRERLPDNYEEFEAAAIRELDDAALLVVDHRPAAWAGADQAPHAFAAWSTLPLAREVQVAGGCFTGAPRAASSEAELIADLWRVHTESGTLEMGLRFALPAGFSLEIPDPSEQGYTFPLPICAGEGRMAVMLSGPEGFAWFAEGDASFEQITTWGERTSFYPENAPSADRRIIGAFSWYPTSPAAECELSYQDDGTLLLVDHVRDLELPLAPDANAALVGK